MGAKDLTVPEPDGQRIRQGNDDTEVISVLIKVDKMSIRLNTAYGRKEVDRYQEGDKDEIKDKFWDFFGERNTIGSANGRRCNDRV